MTLYYVDFENGSDANNGTSVSTPWQRPPQFDGVGPAISIGANDIIYIKGTYTAQNTGTNLWLINATRYTHGCKLLPWNETEKYTIIANGAYDVVVSVGRRVVLKNCIAQDAKTSTISSGFRFASGSDLSLIENCTAQFNRRFGFYGNNVSATANIKFVNCFAYRNTSSLTDNRFGAGFHMDATGGCVFERCYAKENGATALVGNDLDGRGFSIQTSPYCVLQKCLTFANGDPEGKYGNPNGSGLEGFNSAGVKVYYSQFLQEATGGEIKYNCDNWEIIGNVFEGVSTGILQWGYFDGVGSTSSAIVNNTIISHSVLPFSICLSLSSGNCTVLNNIFIKTRRGDWPNIEIANSLVDVDPSTVSLNYNIDFGNTNNLHIKYQNTGSNSTYTKAAWQALYPSHSVNSQTINPNLKNTFVIGPSSPAYLTGVNYKISRSLSGNMFKSTPSIGAYEHLPERAVR